ncbi:MAG: FadR family transcriptional regulator [Neisseriaceae bacterium]|jgi:GntR family transcriptional repressor for pyruvate dehydrogenase complex|nr:MAG: FadR family transcriptional regulator [Neisseriaceae bacterium]
MALGNKTLPDQVADYLIARIFIGELKPGDKLPAERQLADQLGVDRTSLRMALRHLSRLGLLRSVHGSGITIEDYADKGGLDFLATVFSMEQLDLGGRFLLEALDQWCFFMPLLIMSASQQREPGLIDAQALRGLLQMQLALIPHKQEQLLPIVELELELHDRLNNQVGSIIMRLINNSTRILRRRIIYMLFDSIDLEQHIAYHQRLLEQILENSIQGHALMDRYRAYLTNLTQELRTRLRALPPEPRLLRSPL